MKLRKIICTVVGITVLTSSLAVSAASFNDMKGHWSESYVNDMVERGYIKGYEDNTFRPDKTISNTEALILLSRMLGVEDSEYSLTAKNAVSAYSGVLSKFNCDYENEIAFLLYRGVLDTDDLDTYISNANKDKALSRYQCAILLTKLLGAEKEVQGSVFLSSSYSDTAQIPADARPYVEYVRDAKIMEGMGVDSYGDPIFGPLVSVTRGQMAKMLSGLIDELNVRTASGTITSVDTFNDTVAINGSSYEIEDDTLIKLNGEDSELEDISRGLNGMVTIVRNKVSMVEAYEEEIEVNSARGVIVSVSTDSNGRSIIIADAEDSSRRSTYKVSNDVRVVISGAVDSFAKLKSNSYVELTFENGVVSEIEVIDKNATVTATLKSYSLNAANPTVTVADLKGNETTYECSLDGVSVTRNGSSANLNDLVAGDSVVLKLVYNKVSKINAESASKNLSGKITSVTHTENGSTLCVTVDGKAYEYTVASDALITIDSITSTVYDLRPGSSINFKVDSTKITKVETTSTVARNGIIGTVTAVQSSYNLLIVNDGESDITIVVNSSTNIIKSTTGASISLAKIAKGDEVTVMGSNATGVFVATVIVVQ